MKKFCNDCFFNTSVIQSMQTNLLYWLIFTVINIYGHGGRNKPNKYRNILDQTFTDLFVWILMFNISKKSKKEKFNVAKTELTQW